MRATADVVIIGGGIQGISLAYHLARRGVTNVCLLEANTLGSGSSGRSSAIIGFAFQNETCLPLAVWSFGAYMRFQEEVGASPGYEPIGCLLLAGVEGASILRQRHALLSEHGIESYVVDRKAILSLTPGLNLDDPILGPTPNMPGFYNDCGWGGHGIMHAPAAGQALAKSIVEGQARSVPGGLSRFGVERFDSPLA